MESAHQRLQDEVARLRHEVARLNGNTNAIIKAGHDAYIKLTIENNRLRECLKDLQTIGEEEDLWTIKDICREALETK